MIALAVYWRLSVQNFIRIRSDLTFLLYDALVVTFLDTVYSNASSCGLRHKIHLVYILCVLWSVPD